MPMGDPTLRIVSLLPSATEIVCALGAGENLVGVSHECDFPAGVAALPHCSAPKRPLGTSSYEIDRTVKAILGEALSVYRVDVDRLKALAPDMIVTQAQCDVCAVSETELIDALAAWTGRRPDILTLSPLTLADALADIRRVGAGLGRAGAGDRLAQALEARMAAIEARAAGRPSPRVGLVDWIEPLIMGAEWMPELVARAGGEAVLAEPGGHARAIPLASLAAADPDIIVVAPCGFGLAETRRDMPGLAAQPGWSDLRAVRSGEVYLADGNHYFNRPGPRLVESLEILAEILHPDLFGFGHRGAAFHHWPAREGECP